MDLGSTSTSTTMGPVNTDGWADWHELQPPATEVPSEDDGVSNGPQTPRVAELGSFMEYPPPEEISTPPASVPSQKALGHGHLTLTRWNALLKLITSSSENSFVALDGASLDIASVVAVAR
ncbi:MAG: hypothetical protein Q9226_008370 [Calogaya cf. arnoldii]